MSLTWDIVEGTEHFPSSNAHWMGENATEWSWNDTCSVGKGI
jgi:hypothetical protein